MSEGGIGVEVTDIPETVDQNKSNFLKASETAQKVLDGFNLDGFQLGGGAVDFALGKYRRAHSDIDVVYVVDSKNWQDYLTNPHEIPAERESFKLLPQDPEMHGVTVQSAIAGEALGAPVLTIQGGDIPIVADFVEAYKNAEDNKEYVMLPIYQGGSYIKIPSSEIREAEIEGIRTFVPSSEVLYLMKEQAVSLKRTIQGGPPPDTREKSKKDMNELKGVVDMDKVQLLKKDKIGFNFSPASMIKFRANQLVSSLLS